MSINTGGRLTSINEKSIPLSMSNEGKAILAPESDCESCGSNSGVKPKTTLLLGPEVNPIAEVGNSHTLAASTPSEPGPPTPSEPRPPTKKRKAKVDEVLSLLMKCTNLPRPTMYAALRKLENKGTRMVWMNDSLENKLDFLEDATPRKSMKDFIYWRNGPEVRFLC